MKRFDQALFNEYQEKLGNQVLFNGVHNFTILNNSLGWTQKKYFEKFFESKLPCISFSVAKETKSTYWVTQTHFDAIAKEVFLKYWKDQKVIIDLEKERQNFVTQIEHFYTKLTPEYLANLSEEQIKKELIVMNDAEGYANCNGWYVFSFEKDFVKGLLKEAGSSITSERLDELWEVLTLPVSLSFDKRSALKVFDLLDEGISTDALALATQYFYAGFNGSLPILQAEEKINAEYLEYGTKEVREKVRREILEELDSKRKEYTAWLETLTAEEKKLAEYTKHIIRIRDLLRDTLGMTVTVVYRVAGIYTARADMAPELSDFLLFQKLTEGVEYIKSLEQELIKRKTEGFSIFVNYDDGRIYREDGADINREYMEKLFADQHGMVNNSQIKELKGAVGSKGMAEGRVCVVVDIQADSSKMKEGDILVTGMTRPEFVPLMKIAKAIVTDEGGITCHAAIVSRELKKPCVIGTKNATKILKDGDLIEVDAMKGIVTIKKLHEGIEYPLHKAFAVTSAKF